MSWLYLPGQAVGYSAQSTCSAGKPSVTSKKKNTRSKSSKRGSETAISTMRQSGQTCDHSPSGTTSVGGSFENCEKYAAASRLLQASRVNHSVTPAKNWERTILETAGPIQLGLLEKYDPASSFSKTFPVLSHPVTFLPLSRTWWTARIRSSRHSSYLLVTLELTTRGSGSGLWPTHQVQDSKHGILMMWEIENKTPGYLLHAAVMWPTPTARLGKQRGPQAKHFVNPDRSNDLDDAVAYYQETWPTPSATDYKGSSKPGQRRGQLSEAVAVGGQLNPTWVEWLIGWPLGWTDLGPLATDRFRTWLRLRGEY